MDRKDLSNLVVGEADTPAAGEMVRLCPVSEGAAVRMAALVREFHPSRFSAGADNGPGSPGVLLHPAWISGLAAAGIERAHPGSFVQRLEIVYLRQVGREEALAVETTTADELSDDRRRTVSFRILSSGRVVAQGTAVVAIAPPLGNDESK